MKIKVAFFHGGKSIFHYLFNSKICVFWLYREKIIQKNAALDRKNFGSHSALVDIGVCAWQRLGFDTAHGLDDMGKISMQYRLHQWSGKLHQVVTGIFLIQILATVMLIISTFFSEHLIKAMADQMVDEGYLESGYGNLFEKTWKWFQFNKQHQTCCFS